MKRILCISVLAVLAGCTLPEMQSSAPVAAPQAIPVFFEPWSAALDSHALSSIAIAAQSAKADPQAKLLVTGAADATGSADANHYISKTRAQVVADQLVTDGVNPSHIRVRGVGTVSAPVAPGAPAQYARRVLIQFKN